MEVFMKEETVNVAHARNKRPVYEQIAKDRVCPFCVDFSGEKKEFQYHSKPVIIHGEHWVVTENFDPYQGTQHHLLLVHRRHIVSFSELGAPALEEFASLIGQLERKFSLPAGVLLFRFGDTSYTGGSVSHFHGHFLLGGKGEKGVDEPLMLFGGYKKK